MRWIILFLAAFAASAVAQTPASITDAERAAVQRAEERGALIYAYDQAAWHGTDHMMAKVRDPAAKMGGYIADGPATAPRLIFFDKTGTKAVYVAHFNGNQLQDGKELGPNDDARLSPLDQRMIAARKTASEALIRETEGKGCIAAPFNTVVIPPLSDNGPVTVYFLTPQTINDSIIFGKHYAIDVDPEGKAGPVRRFTNTCLNMSTKRSPGVKPEMIFVTHLLDPTPTEIHVFLSRTQPLPLGIITDGKPPRIWQVTNGRIGAPVEVRDQTGTKARQ